MEAVTEEEANQEKAMILANEEPPPEALTCNADQCVTKAIRKIIMLDEDEILRFEKLDNEKPYPMCRLSDPKRTSRGLDDSVVASVLQGPNDDFYTDTADCLSDNIGVRSMSVDFLDSEALNAFESAVFAEVIREATDALEVLKGTIITCKKNEKNNTNKSWSRQTMRKKDSCAIGDERKLIYGEDAGYAPVVPHINVKLIKDRDLAYNVFRKIHCELENDGCYDWFRSEVSAIIESKEKEHNLEVNLKIWTDLAKRLKDSETEFEAEFQAQKKEYIEKATELAEKIDGSYCANREKLDYIRRLEASKLEQQNMRLELQEGEVLNEIKELKKNRKIDAKVSKELQAYGNYAIQTGEDEIAAWQAKYNDELEQRQQAAMELQEKIDKLQEFMEESRILQAQRQVVVDVYLDEQRKIQEEIDYWIAVNASATRIQAIWRGYMVRHELGRFAGCKSKPPPPPKKKKGKKGKKKGKKK